MSPDVLRHNPLMSHIHGKVYIIFLFHPFIKFPPPVSATQVSLAADSNMMVRMGISHELRPTRISTHFCTAPAVYSTVCKQVVLVK